MVLEAPFVVMFIVVIWLLAGWVAVIPVGMLALYVLFALLWLPVMNERVMHAGSARTARQHMLMETMAGLRELKGLGAESVWQERFRETAADTLTALYKNRHQSGGARKRHPFSDDPEWCRGALGRHPQSHAR